MMLLERSHLPDRAQLVAEILERERVVAAASPRAAPRPRRRSPASAFSMSDSTSPMPSTRDTTRSGWNDLEVLQPLAAADERDRHADDRHHRQRCAASGVAIELRQHDAGHADTAVELAGALDRVLSGHRVRHVQLVGRLDGRLDRLQLHHQRVVDVQAAGGVDDQHVEAGVLRLHERARGAREPDPSHRRGRAPGAAPACPARSAVRWPRAGARRWTPASGGDPGA